MIEKPFKSFWKFEIRNLFLNKQEKKKKKGFIKMNDVFQFLFDDIKRSIENVLYFVKL